MYNIERTSHTPTQSSSSSLAAATSPHCASDAKQLGSALAYIILLLIFSGMLVGLWFEEKEWFHVF